MCTVSKLVFPLKTPVIDVLQRHLQIIMKDKRKERKRNIPEAKICAMDIQTVTELWQVLESMYSEVCVLKMYQADSTGHCWISLLFVGSL